MLKIALTGPSGSGKGYVSDFFKSVGIRCLDTDKVVHRIYEDPSFASRLSDLLSTDFRKPDGTADRKKIAGVVFSDARKMDLLLGEVYPRVRLEIFRFFSEEENKGARAAVVDAPQLFEAGFEEDFDLILCVYAPKAQRLARVMRRDGVTRKEALQRFSHQMSARDYLRRCHEVVNNADGADVKGQFDRLLSKWGL